MGLRHRSVRWSPLVRLIRFVENALYRETSAWEQGGNGAGIFYGRCFIGVYRCRQTKKLWKPD